MAGGVIPFDKAIAQLCQKSKADFMTAMEAVLEAYGFADWVVIPRAVDGSKLAFWTAGEGEAPIGDRERSMLLIGEMEDLKLTILEYWRSKQTPKKS